MYIKVTESGGRRYAKLVEAYRDEKGVSRQRVIANLGRVDTLKDPDNALSACFVFNNDLLPECST